MKRKKKMFCSQFVCNVLKKADENLIDVEPELCSPTDLLNVKGLRQRYIGKIIDLVEIKKKKKLIDIYE